MTRSFLASAVVNLVLMAVVTFLLIGQGERDARIGELERAADRVEEIRELEAKRVKDLEVRNGALVAAQAEACGVEGSDAFDRGVRTGMAVCLARTPAQ